MNLNNILTLRYDPSLERQLRNVIRNHITNNGFKKVALALSSGVDSNLMLYLTRKEFPDLDIDCITVNFNYDDSVNWEDTEELANKYDGNFRSVIVDDPLKDLPELIKVVKEPRWNVYQYFFMKEAKKLGCPTVITGDGGDELFAGYTFRYKKYLETVSTTDYWATKAYNYLQCHERDWVPDQEDMFIDKFDWNDIYSLLRPYFDNDLKLLDQVLLADYNGKLIHDFTPTNRKLLDYVGIVGVTPLLDPIIIDIANNIPSHLKYNAGTNIGKIPLRDILPDKLPIEKKGFSMDLRNLWNRNNDMITSTLDNSDIFNIINKEWYNKALIKVNDVRYINKMLQLLALHYYLENKK